MLFGPHLLSVNELALNPVKQTVNPPDYQFSASGKCYECAYAQKPKKYCTQESHNVFLLFNFKFHSSIILFAFFADKRRCLV